MANQVVYGFHHLADAFADRVTTVGVDVVNDAIAQAMAEHNRQMDALLSLFVVRTTRFKTVYKLPVATRNQPLDEFGRPMTIKALGKYEVAWPLQDSGNAFGWDWQTGIKMTVEDVNRNVDAIQMGDMRWVFDHILAALFTNVTWTHNDPENGALTIQPLANGDTQVYQVFAGGDVGATDTHFLAQANAIGAGADNPYPTIYTELTEHPENLGGTIISFIPTGLKATTQALATFNPVLRTEIEPGSGTDRLVGTLGVAVPGGDASILGMEDSGVWVAEYPRLPAGYIVSLATGGPPPLAMREDIPPELRGFVEMPRNEDMPWYQRSWLRKAGFGAWNRVAAVITRIGNGTYAIPTGYTSPMP